MAPAVKHHRTRQQSGNQIQGIESQISSGSNRQSEDQAVGKRDKEISSANVKETREKRSEPRYCELRKTYDTWHTFYDNKTTMIPRKIESRSTDELEGCSLRLLAKVQFS